jgi:hypothetical protein
VLFGLGTRNIGKHDKAKVCKTFTLPPRKYGIVFASLVNEIIWRFAMRKLLAVVLVLMMILPLVGIGENKYDGMSLNELQAEYTAILKAMWSTDEWQEMVAE